MDNKAYQRHPMQGRQQKKSSLPQAPLLCPDCSCPFEIKFNIRVITENPTIIKNERLLKEFIKKGGKI